MGSRKETEKLAGMAVFLKVAWLVKYQIANNSAEKDVLETGRRHIPRFVFMNVNSLANITLCRSRNDD